MNNQSWTRPPLISPHGSFIDFEVPTPKQYSPLINSGVHALEAATEIYLQCQGDAVRMNTMRMESVVPSGQAMLRAAEIKDYYTMALCEEKLSGHRAPSNFRTALADMLNHPNGSYQDDHVGLLFSINHFYQEDLMWDRLRSEYGSVSDHNTTIYDLRECQPVLQYQPYQQKHRKHQVLLLSTPERYLVGIFCVPGYHSLNHILSVCESVDLHGTQMYYTMKGSSRDFGIIMTQRPQVARIRMSGNWITLNQNPGEPS